MSQDLEVEIATRDKEKMKWIVVATQKYGVIKFLIEKPEPDFDDNVLYISKNNINWRNSIIKQGHEESLKLQKELKELPDVMQEDLKCIDIQLLKMVAKLW